MVSITHMLTNISTDDTPEAWILRKNFANCQLSYCSDSCKPEYEWRVESAYNIRRRWTIFTPASKKKSGGISVSSTRPFCFVRGGCFLSPYSILLVCPPFSFPSQTSATPFLPPNPLFGLMELFSQWNQRSWTVATTLTIEYGLLRESREQEDDSQGARN